MGSVRRRSAVSQFGFRRSSCDVDAEGRPKLPRSYATMGCCRQGQFTRGYRRQRKEREHEDNVARAVGSEGGCVAEGLFLAADGRSLAGEGVRCQFRSGHKPSVPGACLTLGPRHSPLTTSELPHSRRYNYCVVLEPILKPAIRARRPGSLCAPCGRDSDSGSINSDSVPSIDCRA